MNFIKGRKWIMLTILTLVVPNVGFAESIIKSRFFCRFHTVDSVMGLFLMVKHYWQNLLSKLTSLNTNDISLLLKSGGLPFLFYVCRIPGLFHLLRFLEIALLKFYTNLIKTEKTKSYL
ncbi:MAG: hypothetical protein MHMPM18_004642 [Marteilia pararefringens]